MQLVAAPALLFALAGLLLRLRRGLFAGVDGGGVAADVTGDLLSIVGFDQRLVNRLWSVVA